MREKKIVYSRNFLKHFAKRIEGNETLEQRLSERTNIFIVNTRDPAIRDHQLSGEKKRYRAFSVTGDIRVVYEEEEEFYRFLDIGTHSQVY